MINEELTNQDLENEYQAQQLNEYNKRELLERKREEYRQEIVKKVQDHHRQYCKLWLSHLGRERK